MQCLYIPDYYFSWHNECLKKTMKEILITNAAFDLNQKNNT